jgi:hypothetical protein
MSNAINFAPGGSVLTSIRWSRSSPLLDISLGASLRAYIYSLRPARHIIRRASKDIEVRFT